MYALYTCINIRARMTTDLRGVVVKPEISFL